MSSCHRTRQALYSAPYQDDDYQYRHVILDKAMVGLIPKNRLMDECEWRALGIKQGSNWEHYLIHKPEPYVLMFRRLLKYRHESISECDDKNVQFPTVCIPRSATANQQQQQRPLSDSTNSSLNESGFESH